MKLRGYLFLFLILCDACIQPLSIDLESQGENIVIDGMITDQPGPYMVKIFKTKPLDGQLDNPNWVTKASVILFDDNGNEEVLMEISDGNYQTKPSGTKGVIGRSYHIKITTFDQKIYESVPEKLLPVGEIKSIYFDFNLSEDPVKSDYLKTTNGFNVFVDAELLNDQNDLIRWRVTGLYEVKTYPEKRMAYQASKGGDVVKIPDPPGCSGWSYSRGALVQGNNPCTCCNCWITEYAGTAILSDKKFIKNEQIQKASVLFIPASRRLFHTKYLVEVEQLSVSERTYQFWNLVRQQVRNGSDLFQVPPPKTAGNIKVVSQGAIPALGLFSASSVKKKSIYIYRNDIPYYLPPIDTIAESCRELSKYSSNVKPLFW
jgi:hypothetical protein